MPAAPKFCNALGEIWGVEVLHQSETQNFCGPSGNIGIAGEIAVNLKSEQNGGQNCHKTIIIIVAQVIVDGIDENSCPIRNDQFLEIQNFLNYNNF